MIRTARESDAPSLLDIYAYYVENTAFSFEYNVPTVDEFKMRITKTLCRYPYLVYEHGGEILGYTYAGVFHERSAYDWSVETSIYVRKEERQKGIGRELYSALENALALQHVINLNACIAWPSGQDRYLTCDSGKFHEKMGYRLVGEFRQCGYKFGKWYNMIWMEKFISDHPDHPETVLPFGKIREELHAEYGI